jgi:hypothetical protein
VPARVWELSQFPGGGRIRLATDSTELRIRYTGNRTHPTRISSGLDVYLDGEYWNSVMTLAGTRVEQTFYSGAERADHEVTIYLPLYQAIEVHAIGVDRQATIRAPGAFRHPLPLVLYGSSVAQGVGAGRPAMTYQAILSRSLHLDFINLGFGGAGKAEPEVVRLVSGIDGCCFLFDLGKSYGQQDASAYLAMLEVVRADHPMAPLVCITPIYSTHERYDASYRDLSEHTRFVVRDAVAARRNEGDLNVHLIEGLDLLGPADASAFLEGVHPSDLGYWRTAQRLEKLLLPFLGPLNG